MNTEEAGGSRAIRRLRPSDGIAARSRRPGPSSPGPGHRHLRGTGPAWPAGGAAPPGPPGGPSLSLAAAGTGPVTTASSLLVNVTPGRQRRPGLKALTGRLDSDWIMPDHKSLVIRAGSRVYPWPRQGSQAGTGTEAPSG